MSLSTVARISQSDRVSHPGTVVRCSQTYNLSLSVRLPEAHFPVPLPQPPSHKHGLVAMLFTDYVDLVFLAVAVRCHLATQL